MKRRRKSATMRNKLQRKLLCRPSAEINIKQSTTCAWTDKKGTARSVLGNQTKAGHNSTRYQDLQQTFLSHTLQVVTKSQQ